MRNGFFIQFSYKHLYILFILSSVLCEAFLSVGAQTRRPAPPRTSATAVKQASTQRCSGGWSGVITLRKTLVESLESDEPGIRKSIDRIKKKYSRNYDYTGRAVVDGTNPQTPVVNTTVALTDTSLNWGEERVFDTCNSRENGHWFISQSTDDQQKQAQASGPARSFNLYIDERGGTYTFSLRFPDAQGVYRREERLRRSGFCQPKNNEPWDRSTNQPTTVDGESFSVEMQKLDPNNPDVISGSKIWGDDGKGQVRTFVYQATWHLTRCPGKLLITDLKFEHPKFPNYEDWQEIVEQRGTIDGNRVRIKARVLNMTAETKYATLKLKETYKGDQWNGMRPDEPLPESETSLRLDAGEEREVEYIWDTEGQSWFDDGRPHLLHRIKAELEENGQKRDEKVKPLNIGPKPVVLVHGLWSSADAWIPLYPNLLTASHSHYWKAYPVGERPEKGKLNTGGAFLSADKTNDIYANADELAKYVRYAQEDANAWHVDIVAHSMGGLISRLYIHKLMPEMPDYRPLVKHLVMLGTPNAGSPCADTMDLKFRLFSENVQAVKDLKPENVARFNQFVTERKGVKFSALAGNPIPVMCGGYAWNDGVVSVASATHGIEDFAYSNDIHTELTDGRNFGNFVKPHLVTGPKKTYPIAVKSDPNGIDRWKINGLLQIDGKGSFINAAWSDDWSATDWSAGVPPALSAAGANKPLSFDSFDPSGPYAARAESAGGTPALPTDPQSFTAELKLAPKETKEIEVPVEAAANFGVTFLAGSPVSVSLISDKGVAAAKNPADSPLSKPWFRSLYVGKPVAKGVWKLRIENTSAFEQIFLAYGWSAASRPTAGAPVAE